MNSAPAARITVMAAKANSLLMAIAEDISNMLYQAMKCVDIKLLIMLSRILLRNLFL